ncbi:peptidase [Flavobacteriales bacterium 34_180_T64]|nr:peptidase [Flavobacteriales bacterium 34_180_T64]
MKNNYLRYLCFFGLVLFSSISFSQNNLNDSQYGSIIQTYLDQNKSSFNLSTVDIVDISVSKEFFSKKTGITHVYINQRHQGINIFGGLSSVAIKDNAVFYYANNFIENIIEKVNASNPLINAEQAIQIVASEFNLGNLEGLELLESNNRKQIYSSGSISQTNIPVELVYYAANDGVLMLAWDLSIHTKNGKNWWSVRVNALSGEILNTTDWILSCNYGEANHTSHSYEHNILTNFNLFSNNSLLPDGSQYNVFAIPVTAPNDGNRSLVIDPADINASPFGWHDIDGADGPEFTTTRGNNVWSQEDRDGNDDDMGFSPDGSASLNFDFALDLNQPPALYEDVSLTNLFYMNNIMHDVWYQYGFDEPSGNFQENNYGNGGTGGDFVFADGQDGLGLNNASFGTPPDGTNPGMTMFLWSASGDIGDPLTINNGPLTEDYAGFPATFGNPLSSTPITADLVLIEDNNIGGSASTDPIDGCNFIINGTSLVGKIVVIRRGACEFGLKILAAENAGAIAVIMVNNVAGDPIPMGGGAQGGNVSIPSIMVNDFDGEAIIAELLAGGTINGTLVDAGPYQKDGDFDNTIVSHEYGHGISNRLTGGANNVNCLTNATQMGEGWSDWFSLMLTMKSTDLPETGRGMGTYAIGQSIAGGGIRNAPYSTDFAVNDFTYADTNDEANVSQPHGLGFIWATMLWDLTWAYVEKYGFDEDIYNGTGGNNKVMQLVLDGLKLQRCNPGFVDGRDAILSAEMALTGGEDQCLIWEVFANRGLGFNADQGTIFSRADQTEDFSTPPATDPTLMNCNSLSVNDFKNNDFKIYPNPTNSTIYIATNKSYGDVLLTLTDINGRQVISKKLNLFGEVSIDISQLDAGLYILNMKGQSIDANEKIIKN